MSTENSTEYHQSVSNTTTSALGVIVNPAWQLALKVEFYFKYAVLGIAIFGTISNALVLYALIAHNAREAKKRAINLLIINQNVLDLYCCLWLVASVSIQIHYAYLTGSVCTIFMNDTTTYVSLWVDLQPGKPDHRALSESG